MPVSAQLEGEGDAMVGLEDGFTRHNHFFDLFGRRHVGQCCKPRMLIDGLHRSTFICSSVVSLKMFILMNLILVCSGFLFLSNDNI